MSGPIRWKSLEMICRSLATMLHSGIDVRKSIDVVARRVNDARSRDALASVSVAVRSGSDLADALRAETPAFPDLMVDLVAVAEQTGNLPEILTGLADHYDNNIKLRRAFLGQIAWPAIQLIAAMLIVAGMMVVLGWIAESNRNSPIDVLGFGLTGTRGAMIWLGTIGSIAGGGLVLWLLLKRSLAAKQLVDPMLMRVPVLGTCLQSFAIARFSWAYYLTQQTGMPVHKSLKASLKATANGAFIAMTPVICDAVKRGENLTESLALSQLFPEEYIHTVDVAEASGTVPEALHRLSPQFEDQARRSLKVLTTTLAWGIWAMVAAFIVFMIFRIFSWYVGMINNAANLI